MNPIHPPRLFGAAIGSAELKSKPEDFQVEEILGFRPSGEGEHCFVWIEKTDWNSNDVAGHFAEQLRIRKRLISHCGLKDKHAVTRQWFSIHLPGQPSPNPEQLEGNGIRVLKITRNLRKLRRGSHDGNRFSIRLRNCRFTPDEAATRWKQIITHGVPNYFGSQRFGRDGDNVDFALRLFAGKAEVRDRALRGILLSAARSFLFNTFVATRLNGGTWDTALEGEAFGFADNRSLILPHNIHGDERARFDDGTLEITAPLWGEGELHTRDQVRAFESEVAAEHPEITGGLEHFGLKQERRVIRLRPTNSALHWEGEGTLVAQFDLPKGTYATTVLRELVEFHP